MKFNKWTLMFLTTIVMLFATNTFAVPTVIIDQNQYSYGSGGQFTATTSANGTFQTFCIDNSHQFIPGAIYYYTVADEIYPIANNKVSIGSAYLYSSFLDGNLSGYNYGFGQRTSAGLLQYVLWGLEGESTVNFNSSNPFYNDVISQFGSLAAAEADANGAYGVHVMEVYNSQLCGIAQSQLIRTECPPTVPESGTILVSMGIFLPLGYLMFIKTRKQNV